MSPGRRLGRRVGGGHAFLPDGSPLFAPSRPDPDVGRARLWYGTVLAFLDEHLNGIPFERDALL
jgi:hypothetical protein